MKIWSLQVLRFWAALGVVLHHAYNATYQTSHHLGVLGVNAVLFGRAGVDVFFVLSGVIITLTSRGLSADEFVAKRARRILPLYGAFTVVYLIVLAVKGGLGWREVATSLTLWPALDRIVTPVVPVAWTLCFEVLFYAAAAVALWRPKAIWVLFAAYAGALLVRSGPVLQFVGNPIIVEFLLGVGLTLLPKWRAAVWLIPAGLAATWFLAPAGYPAVLDVPQFLAGDMAWRRVLYLGVPAAMIVWGTLQIEGRKGVLSYLGDASYALYLSHLPVVLVVVAALCRYTALPPDAVALLAVASSVALGWRIHELFEKPMLNWLRPPSAHALPA